MGYSEIVLRGKFILFIYMNACIRKKKIIKINNPIFIRKVEMKKLNPK